MPKWKRDSFNVPFDTITVTLEATFYARYDKNGEPDQEQVRNVIHHEIQEVFADRLRRHHGIKIKGKRKRKKAA